MQFATLAIRNIGRNRLRTGLTVAGVLVAVLAFVLLRTILWSWTASVDEAVKDRIGIRNKVSIMLPLPLRYVREIGQIPDVTRVAAATWFGGKDPKHEREFFASIAVDPDDMLNVYSEIKVTPAQVEAWRQNRRGALVGDTLAKKLGWNVGDKVTLEGSLYPGNWEFEIAGIYTADRASVDRSTFWFHYRYLNESLPPDQQDRVGWVMARVGSASHTAEIAKQIDRLFDERDVQTISMSERAFQASFMGMVSAVLKVVDFASFIIMGIMLLILGNTIAMGVRERIREYGILRALGFSPRHVAFFVLGEGLFLGAIGGALGLLASYPLVEKGVGRFLEENMGKFFPFFRISSGVAAAAFLFACLLGLVAALVPARNALRSDVTSALRRVG